MHVVQALANLSIGGSELVVSPDSLPGLQQRTREFPRHPAVVAAIHDFLLEDSLDKAAGIYHSVCGGA